FCFFRIRWWVIMDNVSSRKLRAIIDVNLVEILFCLIKASPFWLQALKKLDVVLDKGQEGSILFGLPGSRQQKFFVLRFFDVKEQQGINSKGFLEFFDCPGSRQGVKDLREHHGINIDLKFHCRVGGRPGKVPQNTSGKLVNYWYILKSASSARLVFNSFYEPRFPGCFRHREQLMFHFPRG
ncbi:hypothetical protein Tco_0685216, partial [Tanacetum coccineum]